MISFECFVKSNDIPIYQQIVSFVKRGIVAGEIQQGDELPSRRELSALLVVNPNTIQKAYRELEEEHLIVSRAGAKSSINLEEGSVEKLRSQFLRDDFVTTIQVIKQMGISKEEAIRMIDDLWEEV